MITLMHCAVAFIALTVLLSADAMPRSTSVRTEFIKGNPCPSTGKARGRCPGWEVDHRVALVCGGEDRIENLQWITVADHREKTRAEVKLCRTNKHTK